MTSITTPIRLRWRWTCMIGPLLVNLVIWFDNEWGFANRMLDVARFWLQATR